MGSACYEQERIVVVIVVPIVVTVLIAVPYRYCGVINVVVAVVRQRKVNPKQQNSRGYDVSLNRYNL